MILTAGQIYDRALALQRAAYEREIAIEVEAAMERCAVLCEQLQYADKCTPLDCAAAIRAAIAGAKADSAQVSSL